MKLSVGERLTLGSILPSQASMADHRILRDLKDALSFTEEEFRDLEIAQTADEDGQVRTEWKSGKDSGKEVEFGGRAREIVMAQFKMIEDSGAKVPESALDLYERFLKEEPANV